MALYKKTNCKSIFLKLNIVDGPPAPPPWKVSPTMILLKGQGLESYQKYLHQNIELWPIWDLLAVTMYLKKLNVHRTLQYYIFGYK